MLCPKCGADSAPGNQFCPKCGAAMPAEAPPPPQGKVFCPKCGAENAGGDQFCPKCGTPFAPGAARPGRPGSTIDMDPNVAGLLCYLGLWVTGLVFYLIEKENKFVRFHAMQSIVVFGAFTVLWVVFGILWMVPVLGVLLSTIAWIAGVVLWIILMVKAYQGEKFKLPVAGDIAEKNS